MQVSDIMTRDVQSARPDETVRQAAERMAELDVGSLPVCEGRRVIGVVTDRDIVVRAVAKGVEGDAAVRDVMTDAVETVGEADDLEEVHDRMSAAQVRRLPVVDDKGELIGVVALADIARRERPGESGATLEEISEPRPGESRAF